MPTVLSYAPPERRTLQRYRRYLGPIAVVVAVGSCVLLVAEAFDTRLAIVSHVRLPGDWCGTTEASQIMYLYQTLPMQYLFLGALAMGAAFHLDYGVAISRVSFCLAILGWAICAFVG